MMIYDRTANDVVSSNQIISKKLRKFEELTEAEALILERGTFTRSTVERIENEEKRLSDVIRDAGYSVDGIITKSWQDGDLFYAEDFQRLINNALILRDAFYVLADSPQSIAVKYHYAELNSLEKLLHDIDFVFKKMIEFFRYCGTFDCGEA